MIGYDLTEVSMRLVRRLSHNHIEPANGRVPHGQSKSIVRTACLLPLLSLAWGCPPATLNHDIPHLVQVDEHLWRSGQPKPEGWKYLTTLGIHVAVKLDSLDECPDCNDLEAMKAAGFAWVDCSQPPHDNGLPTDGPSEEQVRCAQDAIEQYWPLGVVIHCVHGDDRTGVEVYFDCLTRRAQPKSVCEKELRDNNYHPELLGLELVRRRLAP